MQKSFLELAKNWAYHCSELQDYKPGDLVWLEGTNIETQQPAKKLDHLQHGPFIDMPSFWLVLETGSFTSYTSLSLIMYFWYGTRYSLHLS